MKLEKYWEKRDFEKTEEPKGEEKMTGGHLRYSETPSYTSALRFEAGNERSSEELGRTQNTTYKKRC